MTEQTPGGADAQLRLLLESITDSAAFLLGPDGRVSSWGPAAERLLGHGEAEAVGQPVALFFTPEDLAAGQPEGELHEAAESGGSSRDGWQVRKDGSRFWARCVTTALRDAAGQVRGFARAVRDQTGELKAEEAVRAADRRARALFENAWDGVTLLAADGTILDASAITFRGLGYTQEEYLGRHGLELLHSEDVPVARSLLAEVLRAPGAKVTAQYRLRHKDGSWRWVEAVGANLLTEPGVEAIVVNHRDVTDRKEAERLKDEWLGMLAHELRGPLSPVCNAVQILLLKDAPDPESEQARDVIARQTRHLARIVDDLLEVTRLLRGKVRLRRERLDLTQLVRLAAEDHRRVIEGAGMRLVVDVPETPVWVAGDATRLSQVVGNLLDNALKFRNGGDRVEVSVRADPDHRQAVLVVRDRGVGIEPQLLPVLFDIFAQADRSLHRSGGGLGLGLTLVQGLVRLHGGEVRAASAGPGMGAEFTVLLPLEREPAPVADGTSPPRAAGRPLRILVIEDHRDSADTLRVLLGLMGHEVRVAYTGSEGVREATEWRPEVIISDIGLPGLDGYAVASELRRRPETAHACLIAVTGYGGEWDRRRALESGFDFHLTKPADPAVLEELLTRRA